MPIVSGDTHAFAVGVHTDSLRTGPISGNIRIGTDDPAFLALNVPIQGDFW